jgi:biotin transport system permease protein
VTTPLYVAGNSRLHRVTAGGKLLMLLATGVGVFLTTSVAVLGSAAVVAVLLLLSVRAPRQHLIRQVTGPLVILAVVAGAASVFQSVAVAGTAVLRLIILLSLALSVTLSTKTSDLLDVMERVLAPLDRLRLVNSSAVALAVSLALRFIPEVYRRFVEIREAQAARGLQANPVALVVPLVVRVLRSADEIAAAIDARCFPPAPAHSHPSEEESRT